MSMSPNHGLPEPITGWVIVDADGAQGTKHYPTRESAEADADVDQTVQYDESCA